MTDVTSKFPNEIDPLSYYSDVTISQQTIMDQYNDYITQGQYSSAYDLIDQSTIFGWFASYFNMIENRISSTQTYLTKTLSAEHPDQNLYTESEPTEFADANKTRDLAVGDVWVSTYED